MNKRKDYVADPDPEFLNQAMFLLSYVTLHAERFRILPPEHFFKEHVDAFEVCVKKCALPTCSKIDVIEKNDIRRVLEKEYRSFAQGFLVKNPKLTRADRECLGLRTHDAVRTPVGVPMGLVSATVAYPGVGALDVITCHVETTSYEGVANYGVAIRYGVFPFIAPPVEDIKQLSESVFTRRKKNRFNFDKKDSRKLAWFCLRYENSKGEAGRWGPFISAIIP
jgi:hypothetical protein